MKRYYNLFYIVIITASVVLALLGNFFESFPLHIAAACTALAATVIHTVLTAKHWKNPVLELIARISLLATFAMGIPIANNVIPTIDALHKVFAFIFVAAFLVNYSVKYIFKKG